ncbi:hypothetical protein FH609_006085 [Streptomyces sp. 3MP-14]|uniref:DUF6879 domain-containing protein n=1 Tax=Streptomyces mimosae TaxID=2586635 RepID=A0A5N6AQ62_9ACTN|nr:MULTISPECIES: DUF6879 family protein [Streptomyces]KAB8169839.1 hypothetical protein FH607_003765 [Streptomyces mimosae]KAB8178587.1 hypothetical protein FH609_006085 [Streptomyces sp. 3MP-14]
MPDLEIPPLDLERGVRMSWSEYQADFAEVDARVRGHDSWKLERAQHFEESTSSRQALKDGDWERALSLLDEGRGKLAQYAEEDRRKGSFFHRVRIVEEPLTPYLQWELHSLRISVEYGERVRVVPGALVRQWEAAGPLPEVVVLGGLALYRVNYTPEGVPAGGVRLDDPELVAAWEAFIATLYERGEDLADYFDRAVAPLPPPALPGGRDHQPA